MTVHTWTLKEAIVVEASVFFLVSTIGSTSPMWASVSKLCLYTVFACDTQKERPKEMCGACCGKVVGWTNKTTANAHSLGMFLDDQSHAIRQSCLNMPFPRHLGNLWVLFHEENILGGRKPVHVVFKYRSRSLLWKGVPPPPPSPNFSKLICRYFVERRRNRYSHPQCFWYTNTDWAKANRRSLFNFAFQGIGAGWFADCVQKETNS